MEKISIQQIAVLILIVGGIALGFCGIEGWGVLIILGIIGLIFE